jgi:hypothetical protein
MRAGRRFFARQVISLVSATPGARRAMGRLPFFDFYLIFRGRRCAMVGETMRKLQNRNGAVRPFIYTQSACPCGKGGEAELEGLF